MQKVNARDPREEAAYCAAYAATMARTEAEGRPGILKNPHEFDFTSIQIGELSHAIEYEYAREDVAFRNRAVGWLDSKTNKITNRERLFRDDESRLAELLPTEPGSGTSLERLCEYAFLELYPSFPLPWLKLHPEDRKIYCEEEAKWQASGIVSVSDSTDTDSRNLFEFARTSGGQLGHYYLRVDWRRSPRVKDVIADFAKWAGDESRKHVRSVKIGKAAAAPFHRLKQLSALRISRAGVTYSNVWKFIKDHKWENPKAKSVIPDYGQECIWHKAIQSAKAYLNEIKDRPIQTPQPKRQK